MSEEISAAEAAPAPAPHPMSVPRRPLVLAAAMAAIVLAAMESTIVATAMPTIVADLGGFSLFGWVFAAYLLTQAVTIPIYGRLADVYGRKPVLFSGAGLFLLGSLLCGFAWGMVPLICFRALQGAGAGAIQPVATTIVGDIYTPAERARVQGYLSGVFGGAAVVGPPLGAFLVTHVSWSVVFWINLPIGIVPFVMLSLFYREQRERQPHRIDAQGSVLLALGAGALMLALIQWSHLATASRVGLMLGGVLLLAMLVRHERRAPEPIFRPGLWRRRIIVLGNLGGCSNGAVVISINAFLPTYIEAAMGYSPAAAGLALAVSSVAWATAAWAAGRLINRTSYRTSATLGAVFLLVGTGMLSAVERQFGLAWPVMGGLFIGVGMGFSITAFVVSIQAGVSWGERGAATSSFMFMRIVGQSVGAAVFGALFSFGLNRHGPQAVEAVNRLVEPGVRHALGAGAVTRLGEAVASSLTPVHILAGGFALLTLVFAWALPARLSPTRPASRDG